MKKIFFIALMLFVSLLSVDECMAQNRIGSSKSNQSIDSKKKVEHNKWSKEHEEALNKKKKQQPVQTQNIVNKAKEQTKQEEVVKEEKPVNQPSVTISNPCSDDLSVELVSLEGNRASQIVTITVAFTNHQINKTVYVKDSNAYNEEGDHFSTWSVGSFTTLTDIKQKTSWKIGQMLPSKNSKLTAISFKIDGCTIEMRNLPIDWK